MAGALESAFEQHRQNILSPGGTTWEGDAKDAALDRVTADTSVVRRQGDAHREAAVIATRGSEDIQAARSRVLEAIAEAEQDDFSVGDDLSVTDNRAYDKETAAARMRAATEHAEFIRWRAEQLVAADALVGRQLEANAAELEGIRFEGDRGGDETGPTIRLVDNKTEDSSSQVESDEHREAGPLPKESTGSWQDMLTPAGAAGEAERTDAAESPLEAMLGEGKTTEENQQPSSLDEALTEVAGKPVEAPPTALERILNQHAGNGKGEDRRYTQHPLEGPIVGADPSVIGDQQARVDAAHESVTSAQAALDDALAQATVGGAGAGPTRDQLDALGQALFDARGEVTSQTEILEDLNAAAGEVGQGRVPIPALPENADVQAFPQEPSAFAEGSRALSEGSFGLIPDVAHDIDVFTNWSEHSAEDRVGAVLDVAGAAPIPGGKFVTEGLEHTVDAFNAGRHVDDALDAGSAGAHHLPDAPSAPDVDYTPDAAGPHGGGGADASSAELFGFEDAGALLQGSEANGGHLIERHVGQTVDDLSARLDDYPGLRQVSTFGSVDEAARALSTALNHNKGVFDNWIANGAMGKIELVAPFEGGSVLARGSDGPVPGSSVKMVLKSDGSGGWYVLTGMVN
ncbi:RNase A-like domain-containing protein [Mycolicibacterium rutilum]|uniref:RNase A-like domain-containing protein n=1 Tax=Mycolicibacterium rutilum TaxID=370526 RepID=UPI001F18EEA3|nr:RNase A-like domain-containing protein [Mycolicibacterium rutilum]